MQQTDSGGWTFRQAWIDGVNTYYPGEPKAGYVVATCWIAQIYKHIPDPKPGYVADWTDLPEWQQNTDADIFDLIEREVAGSG